MDYATDMNFTGSVVPGYNYARALLQIDAAHALAKVQEELNKNQLGLIIFDAYRPYKSVEFFVKTWKKDISENKTLKDMYYPNKTKEQLFKEGFLSSNSSHTRASTVDLSIIELKTLNQIDMGSIFDFFDETSFTDHESISSQSKRARKILVSLMSKYGFINYSKEWWHFQFANEKYNHFYFDFDII